jgi:proteasome accessory factor PafA2
MARLFGIETEYGIAVEGRGAGDLIQESIALVRAYDGAYATGWNYRGEDPRRDMRGFTVERLSTNPDDAQFDAPGTPPMSAADERSDRILGNGARLYNDHGHPEYSTPECSNLRDLVAHDKAGERIVWECAQRHARLGLPTRIYKNNTDYHGASYGTHECVLVRREVAPDTLIRSLIPFLVTRQIYAGCGKVGMEVDRGNQAIFQLSQRADFFSVEASVDTLHNRPLVNTRDEPHATPRRYRRLHVIVGDANMSEWATAIKVGALSLVLALLEEGWEPKLRIADPVQALKSLSRDQSLRWLVTLEDGTTASAVDVQRMYLQEAQCRLAGSSEDADWTLVEWRQALDDLDRDIMLAKDRIDWVAKRSLLEQYMEAEGIGWDDPFMQSLDHAYHDLDPDQELSYGLVEAGEMRRLVTDKRIEAARTCAPADTRAYLRGLFVKRFGKSIRSIGWNGVAFEHGDEDFVFDMNSLVQPNVRILNEEMENAATLDDAIAVIEQKPHTVKQHDEAGERERE